jgi:hypothetical protein
LQGGIFSGKRISEGTSRDLSLPVLGHNMRGGECPSRQILRDWGMLLGHILRMGKIPRTSRDLSVRAVFLGEICGWAYALKSACGIGHLLGLILRVGKIPRTSRDLSLRAVVLGEICG